MITLSEIEEQLGTPQTIALLQEIAHLMTINRRIAALKLVGQHTKCGLKDGMMFTDLVCHNKTNIVHPEIIAYHEKNLAIYPEYYI